jgi:hypothetical protein
VPTKIVLREDAARLVIEHPWYSLSLIALLIFSVPVWDGMVVMFLIDVSRGGEVRPALAIYMTLHAIVGLVATYRIIIGLFNRTTVRVENRALTIEHAPFPWPGSASIPAAQIEKIRLEQRLVKSGPIFKLIAERKDGAAIPILRGLQPAELANDLAQRIQRHLGF